MDLLEPTEAPPAPVDPDRPRHRRAAGRRSRHVAERRQRQRRLDRRRAATRARRLARPATAVTSVLVVLAGIVALVSSGPDDLGSAPVAAGQDTTVSAPVDGRQATLLLVGAAQDGSPASSVTLLSAGASGDAAVVFIPSSVLVEVPGVGLDRLGQAQQYGGGGLVEAAVENALGIEIDGVATFTDVGLGTLLQRIGGATISIPERLVDRAPDGTGTVAFDVGEQYLNGARLARYWSFDARAGTELDAFPRQQQVLDALWQALAEESVSAVLLDPSNPPRELSTGLDGEALAGVLSGVAEAAEAGRLGYHLLPVVPFGTADASLGASYQLVADDVADLVRRVLPGSVPVGGGADAIGIQVLNGVGQPGVGRLVDDALEGLPVRIVLTENARSFDFAETQIIIYDESAAAQATAAQVRDALGVGRILVSRQPQSVVDLSIVVGADFFVGTQRPAGGP